MPIHENSLQNLRPGWTSQTAPRNGGRPRGFVSLTEHLKSLSATPQQELWRIIDDPKALPLRKAAARQLLIAAGELDGIRPSDVLASFTEVADRTEGKAVQKRQVEHSLGDERPIVLDRANYKSIMESSGEKQVISTELLHHDQD